MGRFEVSGRTVLITGAGRGIGADVAARLAAGGANVALVDRDPVAVQGTAAHLGERGLPLVADVTDPAAVQAAVEAAVERFGRLDVVVANAGVMTDPAPVATTSAEEFRRVLDVNVLGTFHTVRAALPHVCAQDGYVLCVSSIAGLIPAPLLAPYVASKHAVDGFARSLRLELARSGARVGVAYFGVIDTDMARTTIAADAVTSVWSAVPPPLGRSVPVGQAGSAIVRGIERRAEWVYAPRWMSGVLAASRGVLATGERLSTYYPGLARALAAVPDPARTPGDARRPGRR